MIKSKILPTLIGFTLCLLTISCQSPQTDRFQVETVFDSNQITEIEIAINDGDVRIDGSAANGVQLTLETATELSNPYQLIDSRLLITIPDSNAEDRIMLTLAGTPDLTIRNFDGNISLVDIGGTIDVRSTAGNIELNDFSGNKATLWAGRGDIFVLGGNGEAIVIGEHGKLVVSTFDGPVSMNTIMGSILYTGMDLHSGDIVLEADHGPVQAELPRSTSYSIELHSSSGEVVCSGESMVQISNGCKGITGNGSESFRIRTVSGRIDFRIQPASGE